MKSAQFYLLGRDTIRVLCGRKDAQGHLAKMQGRYRGMQEAAQDALATH
jgi:hypothetical protein